jgi:hypothetical protein
MRDRTINRLASQFLVGTADLLPPTLIARTTLYNAGRAALRLILLGALACGTALPRRYECVAKSLGSAQWRLLQRLSSVRNPSL